MNQGLADFRAAASGNSESQWLALLAETYGKAGQVEDGLTVSAEALAIAEKNEERMYEAELYRLRGELTLQSQTRVEQASDKSRTSPKRVDSKFRTRQGHTAGKSEILAPRPLSPDPQGEAEVCFLKA